MATADGPTLLLRDAPPRAEQPQAAQCHRAGGGAIAVVVGHDADPAAGVDGVGEQPAGLHGADAAAVFLADAIGSAKRICIVADYDCDGATACAVALRGLALLGAPRDTLHYVVPDRAVHGYGLTPAIVDLALQTRPDVLITVDNGIASLEGVAHAKARGVAVVVTDHHLPALVDGGVVLPDADVIVNPNQPACAFASST